MNLTRLHGEMITVLGTVDEADAVPTTQVVAAAKKLQSGLKELLSHWEELRNRELPALNDRLKQASLPEITME